MRLARKMFESRLTEDMVQDAIVQRLEVMGFRVLITSRRRKKCEHCGKYSQRSDGVTKGLADLVVTHDSWPFGMAVLLEVKGPKTALSDEQKELEMKGRIFIARDQDSAAAILQAMHQRMLFVRGMA